MSQKLLRVFFASLAALLAAAVPLSAGLVITPTFDSTITSDPNAAAIEGVINSVIQIYENTFTNPINVPITFAEGGGLGESDFNLTEMSYLAFSTALTNDALNSQNPNQLAAIAANPIAVDNPVTGTPNIQMKCATLDAVFGAGTSTAQGCNGTDGEILLNTNLTTPGSPGSALAYYLQSVTEHEIDEILGLGSTLGLGLAAPGNNDPSPEDLFRYTSTGARSFTMNNTQAFFSIAGVTDLAQFDNQNDGGDFGDWQSDPLPNGVSPKVQDAYATAGVNPSLGVELTALNVIGYTFANPTPEPGTSALMAAALVGLIGFARKRVG